jgi:uncharacterized protein YjiS (DUF1127 family)
MECRPLPLRPAALPRPLVRRIAAWLARRAARRRQRIDLAGLDDHQLRDIGLTRAMVSDEARKPGWRV